MVSFLYPYSFLLLVFLLLFFRKDLKIDFNPKIIANKQSSKLKKLFLALSLIFMIIALARPVSDKKEINTNNNLKKVALALDISKSMLVKDVYPNRLDFAKQKIKQFIDKFNGEISIMAFSTNTFLISPYTTDKHTLKYLLNNIDQTYITSSGTDFNNLISTAKRLGVKDLVIFSDGGDIKSLDTKGLNVYILLIGTKKGGPIPTKNGYIMKNGKMVIAKINTKILNSIKGMIATTGDSDIDYLIHQNFKKEKNNQKVVVYKELFIYPLSLSLVFLFLSFFSLPRVMPIFFVLFYTNANAGMLDWYYLHQAKEAYNDKNYSLSAKLYSKINNDEAKFNQANSLYKMKKYQEALKLFNSIKDKKLKEKALYNAGNCNVKLKHYDKAIQDYEKALKLDPNDKDAKYNLELLKKHRNKNNNKDNKHNKNNKDNKNHNKNSKNKENNKNNKNNKDKQNKNNKNFQNPKNKNQPKNHKQNKKAQNNKPQNNKNKPQKPIKIKVNNNSEIFNKIKTQTLIYPLSKGESKNEW